MGRNISATRHAIIEGLKRITKTNPIQGITAASIYFDSSQSVFLSGDALILSNGVLTSVGVFDGTNVLLNASSLNAHKKYSETVLPPPAENSAASPSPSGETSKIIAIVISVSAVMLAGLLLVICFVRRNAQVELAIHSSPHEFAEELKELSTLTVPNGLTIPVELSRKQVHLLSLCGSGAFGEVWQAELADKTFGKRIVAAKVLKADALPQAETELFHEAAMLCQFQCEPRIVQLLGVVTAGRPIMMLMEYCAGGSLDSFLLQKFNSDTEVSWESKLRMAFEIADGMAVISLAGAIHMDLAARNILVTERGSCQIGDFGMSKDRRYYMARRDRAIPVRWTFSECSVPDLLQVDGP